ncbi:MAG: glycosyltransferase family 2 protein [Blastochloris sp.]|nr:glycosyltransferase family 2 protein [Blastochloris sp.]
MPEPSVFLSFVLPAYNEADQLPHSLAAIHESMKPHHGITYEVIVCDNNSTDSTSDLARAAGARVVFEPHNQIAKARNTGAQSTLGEWLCFVDADSQVSPPAHFPAHPTHPASRLWRRRCPDRI